MALNEIVYIEPPEDGNVPVYEASVGGFVSSQFDGLSVLTVSVDGTYQPRPHVSELPAGDALYVGLSPPLDALDGDIWVGNLVAAPPSSVIGNAKLLLTIGRTNATLVAGQTVSGLVLISVTSPGMTSCTFTLTRVGASSPMQVVTVSGAGPSYLSGPVRGSPQQTDTTRWANGAYTIVAAVTRTAAAGGNITLGGTVTVKN